MSWTAPRTWVTGEVVTAAQLNEQLRDNTSYLNEPPMCKTHRTTNQSIADSTWTAILFDNEWYDPLAMHSTVTNTQRITIPTGESGRYDMKAGAEFATNGTGNRLVRIVNSTGSILAIATIPPQATVASRVFCGADFPVAAADWLAMECYQASGAALNVVGGATHSPAFSVRRVGPYS